MGLSSSAIGVLLALLETSGIVFTFFISKFPSKSGKYGMWLLLLGVILAVIPFPMLLSPFYITVLCIILYAIPIKAAVPISDSFINLRLSEQPEKYGIVRTFGSLGFVAMSLLMQYFVQIDNLSLLQSSIWMSAPAILMCVTLLLIPKILKPLGELCENKKDTHIAKGDSNTSFFKKFTPLYWLMIVVLSFGNLAQFGPFKFFSLYVNEYLKSDSFAFLWALSAICEIPTMFFSYRFIRRFGSKNLILFCVAMISVRSFVYVLIPTVTGAAIGQLFHCFTFGLLHPATVVFISQEVKDSKNLVLGQAISSVGSAGIASVIGSFAGGFVIEYFGYTQLYIFSGFIPLVGLLLYFILRKKV